MKENIYYSNNLDISHLEGFNKINSVNGRLNLDFQKNNTYALLEIKSNSIENENLTVVSNFDREHNPSSINIYSYQLYQLLKSKTHKFSLYHSFINYRILINNKEGEGFICFQKCNNNNKFIHLTAQRIYSFSISNKASFYIYAKKNLAFNIKIIKDISNDAIKELNYQYNYDDILESSEENFPLIYFIKDVKYNGVNINFNFKYNASNNTNNAYHNLTIRGYSLDYSEISIDRDKNDYRMIDFLNGIEGKYDDMTNSGTLELGNELIQTKYNETFKYVDDKYFMIIIENNNPLDFENFRNDMYVFFKIRI